MGPSTLSQVMKSISIMRLAVGVLLMLPGLSMASEETSSLRATEVAAIQKVIQMLNDMQVKCKMEKQDEEVAFAEFSTWCKMEQAKLTKAIKKEAETIETLDAEVEKLTEEAKQLGKDIGALQNEIAK